MSRKYCFQDSAFTAHMKPTRFELMVLLIAGGIITYYIFVPPLIGLADNGDFGRVMAWRGLDHIPSEYQDRYFRYFNSKYRLVPPVPGRDWYLTSTSLLIIPAIRLSFLFGQDQIFDIRILAALHASFYLLGLWLILVAGRSLEPGVRIVLSGFLVLIFTDVGYIAYFNSFYAEGTALAFLAIATGCGLILITGRSSKVLFLICYSLAIGMVTTSKPMYVPLAPAFGLFGVYLSRYLRAPKRYCITSILAIAMCCIGFWYFKQTTPKFAAQSAYVGLFMDLIPNSSTPRQDLAELGLNPDYEVFSNTTPYQEDSPLRINPQFTDEFTRNIKSYSLPLFYAMHPSRLYTFWRRCAKHAFTTRVDRSGYYEAYTGEPPFAKPFGLWSWIREKVFPKSIIFLGLFFATGLGVLFPIKGSPWSSFYVLYLLFVFIAGAQFFISTLGGGGEPDLTKHLFMFNLAFDVSLLLLILGGYRLLKNAGRLPWKRRGRASWASVAQ